jgi:hypothetical protein
MKSALSVYFLAGIAVILVTPERALEDVPGMAALANWFASLVPGIERLSRATAFPQAMKVALVALWIGFPITAACIHRAWNFNERIFTLKKSDLWFGVLSIWLVAAILILPIYLFFDISMAEAAQAGGRGGLLVRSVTQSRLGAAVVAPLWFCCAALCLGIATSLTSRAASR